jgi:hypothetical protein
VVRVAQIGLALLAALAASHRAGVLHRDVKPSNVLVGDDGRIMLTDFGLAMFEDDDNGVTRPGIVLGSPHYVAPERARDAVSTPQCDMWSLGATLYAAVEGRSPYARSSTLATLTALATEPPDRPKRAGALKPVHDGLLRKDPRARIGIAEAERHLRRIASVAATFGRPAPARPTRPRLRKRLVALVRTRPRLRRWIVAGSAAAALAVVAGLLPLWGAHLGLPGAAWRPHPGAAADKHAPISAALPVSPSPASSTSGVVRDGPLPAGWVWFRHPLGFEAPVPAGWPLVYEEQTAYFCDPHGSRMLEVGPWDRSEPDLTAALTHVEGEENLAGYKRIRIETADARSASAEWEYTYTDSHRGKMHGVNRGFVRTGQAYMIEWRTPPGEWQSNLANFALITDSFQPPTTGGTPVL